MQITLPVRYIETRRGLRVVDVEPKAEAAETAVYRLTWDEAVWTFVGFSVIYSALRWLLA